MTRFLFHALAWLPAAALAQTPAADRMPDGSRDLYLGLGLQSAPRYAGADDNKTTALPVLQFAWSNGVFVSGAAIGWHLSPVPTIEAGPLLAWQSGRNADGDGGHAGGVTPPSGAIGFSTRSKLSVTPHRLAGIDRIDARLLAGGFFNYYWTPQWRLTNQLLAGGGTGRNGVLWQVGVQRVGMDIGRHSIAVGATAELGNRAWNQAWSGVSEDEAARSGYAPYQAGAAVRAVRLDARWNWSLSPSWLLTSGVEVSRLVDVAGHSPLAARPTGVTASTALAWRF